MTINSIINSPLVSSLLGVIIGGLITWAITSYNLNKQFDSQREIIRKEKEEQKRLALMVINEELMHNRALIRKSIDIIEKDKELSDGMKIPGGWIEFECSGWSSYKEYLFIITDDREFINSVAWLYYQFSVLNATRILTIDTAKEIENTLTETKKKINDFLVCFEGLSVT